MNFRDLMNTLDNINKPMLSEALTLSAVIALTSGYEQDDKVRIPKLADLAKQNGLEGLVDPVTGHYVSNEGDEEDEVPFEIGQKLAQAGLLPKNARMEQAGWFDNNDVWNKANADLVSQSSQVSGQADDIADKVKKLQDLFAKYVELYNKKHSAKTGAAPVAGMPPQGIIPAGAQNAMNQAATMLKGATANMPGAQAAINRLPGIQESAGLSNALIESFGYEQLNEDWKDDAGDFARGVGQGATFGLDNNVLAGAKSLFKGTKYKDELAAELDAEKQAHDRNPNLYATGEIGGMFLPTPFSAAGLAAKGIKAGIGASKAAKAAGGLARMGAGYAGGEVIDAANAHTLGTDYELTAPHQPNGSGTSQLAKLQSIINTKPDGKFGPKTQSALAAWQQKNGLPATGKPDAATYAKAGIKEGKEMQQQTVAESIASLRDRLEAIENQPQVDEGAKIDALKALGSKAVAGANTVGKRAKKAEANRIVLFKEIKKILEKAEEAANAPGSTTIDPVVFKGYNTTTLSKCREDLISKVLL
jgi:peptidoglycan hydrolase-like protein with peptidoglycan-binding domain